MWLNYPKDNNLSPLESVAESVKVTVEEFVYEAPLLMLTEPDGTVVSDGVASLNVAIIAPPGFPG